MATTHVRVMGEAPRPYGTEREAQWRQQIKEELENCGVQPYPGLADDVFVVRIVYWLKPEDYSQQYPLGPDLDNLCKPVLDTLFKCQSQGNMPCGCLFPDAGDDRVVKLHLTKVLVTCDRWRGVDVEVRNSAEIN